MAGYLRYPAWCRSCDALLTQRDFLAVDLGPRHTNQPCLQVDTCLAGFIALLEGERLRVEVTQREADQDLLVSIDGSLQFAGTLLCLLAVDNAVEVGAVHIRAFAVHRGNGRRQERRTIVRTHFANTIEIANTGGVEIEVLHIVAVFHNISP